MDETGIPHFIELNGFGAQHAAGSALFHWVHDYSICRPNLRRFPFDLPSYQVCK